MGEKQIDDLVFLMADVNRIQDFTLARIYAFLEKTQPGCSTCAVIKQILWEHKTLIDSAMDRMIPARKVEQDADTRHDKEE